jgi:RimJ/RimL family protein N-acetyltransferase
MAEFDFQPTLTGDRVRVRPLVRADWDGLFAAASDPGIWALHPASDRYEESVFREFFDDAIAGGSAFAFVDHATGKTIGSSRYYGHDPVTAEVEIGWTFLARAYWGGSYNAEVKQLMLDHAFCCVDTVVFWVGETNWRSQRAMEKIGGVQREGRFYRSMGTRSGVHIIYLISKTDHYCQAYPSGIAASKVAISAPSTKSS